MKIPKTTILTLALLFSFASFGKTQQPMSPNKAAVNDFDQIHSLILDSNHKQLKQLLNHGADVNAVDENGNTALLFASKIGDRKVIDLLIEKGADVNMSNATGTTPLMIASKHGNIYAVKTLLKYGADAKKVNNSGFTAYTFAEVYKKKDVLRVLPNQTVAAKR